VSAARDKHTRFIGESAQTFEEVVHREHVSFERSPDVTPRLRDVRRAGEMIHAQRIDVLERLADRRSIEQIDAHPLHCAA
jgi:hypothetical protein